MTMPLDLVLVRHGESEGNVASHRSRLGDHSAFTPEFMARHSSTWRLTDRGIDQARAAGEWIRTNISPRFDRYYVSEYARAMETAALLELPDAVWYSDFYLRERDWGELDRISQKERVERFADAIARREVDGFFWKPPNGESLADLCLRVDRVLGTFHRECPDKRVVVVCHGEVMWALRVRLERLTQRRFRELELSEDPCDVIHNCQVMHYTRVNPDTGRVAPYLDRWRSICPWDTSRSSNTWQPIQRPQSTNAELLADVSRITRMLAT
jgi:NAD+ kinase